MTLLELSIVAIIAGVLAAIGTPSMMGILQGEEVEKGLSQVQSALKDTQKQAMRRSQSCTINLNKNLDPPTMTVTDGECLVFSDTELPDSVAMKTNITNITFSYKGSTTSSGTIVIEPKQGSGEKECLVIASGIGIMRTGVYNGNTNSSVSATNCQTSK